MCRIYAVAVIICYALHFVACREDCNFSNNALQAKFNAQLEPIKGLRNLKAEYGQYLYTVGICTTAADDDKWTGTFAAVLQCDAKTCVNHTIVGRYNNSVITGGTDWMMLKYDDGDQYNHHCSKDERSTTIMIVCDHNADKPVLTALEENSNQNEDCYYLFELSSVVACTNTKQGLSGGSVLILVFFTILGAYLLIGFLYQRIVVGAQGLEQIPNYSFWKNFGKLQADGCDFFCRCGERQENKMYRSIDDNLPDTVGELERDDHLLPM